MCRWLIYKGNDFNINELLFTPENSIIKQSYKKPYTPFLNIPNNRDHHINVDGFGIGWYYNDNNLCIYVNTKPPWNDKNLYNISKILYSKLLFAHIRAIKPLSESIVHDYNCHPFYYKNIMWMHNGEISTINLIKKNIVNNFNNLIMNNIKGNTDSEYAFGLFLSFLDIGDLINNKIFFNKEYIKNLVIRFLRYLLYLSNNSSNKNNISLSLNFALTDGNIIICTRYLNKDHEDPPSLYYSLNDKHLIVSSEPINKNNSDWVLIGKNKIVIINEFNVINEFSLNI